MFAVLDCPYAVHGSYLTPLPKFGSSYRISLNRWPELETLMIRAPGAAFLIFGRMVFVSRKWPKWLVPSCSSRGSPELGASHAVSVYGGIMTPAQLMRTSIWSISREERIAFAAFCTENGLQRSSSMNNVLTVGFMLLILLMTGSRRLYVRPVRMSIAGLAWREREIAVSAPIEFSLAPVIRTEALH